MPLRARERLEDFWRFYRPVLVAFFVIKILQVALYPDPYLMSDSGEYLNSARTLHTNPYKPIGYSVFLALGRLLLPPPIGVPVLQSLLRFVVVLFVASVLHRRYGLTRRVVLIASAAMLCHPTALLLDHYILSDSLFTAVTTAFIGALLLYADRPTWSALAAVIALATVATALRFVGVLYPGLAIVVIALHGRRRVIAATTVAVVTGLFLLGTAGLNKRQLGVFEFTTFDGWAFHGTIAHLMVFTGDELRRIDDPETRLVYEYMLSFPAKTYRTHTTDWYRWHPRSPAKQLMNTFVPLEERPDNVTAARDSSFLYWFIRMARQPSTPAQRVFERFRNKDNPRYPPYVMDYRSAFVLTNELLRKLNRDFMTHHLGRYMTRFYPQSIARLFKPDQTPIYEGQYRVRDESDWAVDQFWPGARSVEWQPRFGDIGAALRYTHGWYLTLIWLLALLAVAHAVRERGRLAIPWSRFFTGTPSLLLLFAIVYGGFVAYSHMMEVRYATPIMMFVIVASALFYAGASGQRS